MERFALLIGDTDTLQDGNYLRFGNALARAGCQVWLCPIDTLRLEQAIVCADGFRVEVPLLHGAATPQVSPISLDAMDLVWVLSLGHRDSFLDKMQLLFSLSQQIRVINSTDAIMHLKSKYLIASQSRHFRHPDTWASTSPQTLFEIMHREGGKFIVKPPAASFGRDVYFLTADSPNVHVILQSMCGPEEDRYCLLQRYVEEIEQGEKRVLIAGGEPVGQYLRTATRDHRTNVEQGADVTACELTADEYNYCRKIGAFLQQQGAAFAGIDLVYPWVLEFNVINPGGITTVESLTGEDLTCRILGALGFPNQT